MKIRRLAAAHARRVPSVLAAALAALALGAVPAAAFGPLNVQYGVGNPGGGGPGTLEVPNGIAIGPEGQVIVADSSIGIRRVSVFSPAGKFRFAFGTGVSTEKPGDGAEICVTDCQPGKQGSGAGELAGPWGVAAGPEGIFVAELNNSRVSLFDYEGRFLRAFGKNVGGPGVDVCTATCEAGTSTAAAGGMDGAWGVAVSGGRVYVADPGNRRVDVFDAATGAFLFAFGKWVGGVNVNVCTSNCQKGVDDAQPGSVVSIGIAAGPGGEIYTVGLGDPRVSVFDADGNFRRRFGAGIGDGPGSLLIAEAIAVDAAGTVYVPDTTLNRLSVFGPEDDFRAAYGRGVVPGQPASQVCTTVCGPGVGGYGIGELLISRAAAVDCRGSLYVGVLGRVEKWGLAETPAPPCPPPPAPAPPAEVSNRVKLGKLKLNKKKGTASLPVTVPGPGTLKVRAGRLMAAKAPRPKRAGKVRVSIRAKGKGVGILNRTGKLTATLRLTYRPTGGVARTVSRKVTLVKTGYARKSPSESKRR